MMYCINCPYGLVDRNVNILYCEYTQQPIVTFCTDNNPCVYINNSVEYPQDVSPTPLGLLKYGIPPFKPGVSIVVGSFFVKPVTYFEPVPSKYGLPLISVTIDTCLASKQIKVCVNTSPLKFTTFAATQVEEVFRYIFGKGYTCYQEFIYRKEVFH